MFCTSCGKQIPDDSVFCPECGAPVAATSKKAVSATPIDIKNPLTICGLVGAALVFFAPFFSWVTIKVEFMGMSQSEGTSLFGMTGLDTFAAIIILLAGLFLIAWDVAEFVPAIKDIKNKLVGIPFLKLIVIGVIVVITIIAMIRKGGAASELEDASSILGDMDDFMKIKVGFGAFLCLIGCIAAAVPEVLPMINKKNN